MRLNLNLLFGLGISFLASYQASAAATKNSLPTYAPLWMRLLP